MKLYSQHFLSLIAQQSNRATKLPSLFTKLFLVVLLMTMMQQNKMLAQGTTCATAINVTGLNYNYQFVDYAMPDSNFYLQFTADTTQLYLIITRPQIVTKPFAELKTIKLLGGGCASPTILNTGIFYMDNDSISFVMMLDNLTIGTNYKLKINRKYQPDSCASCNDTARFGATIIKANNPPANTYQEVDCQLNCNGSFSLAYWETVCISENAAMLGGYPYAGNIFPFNNGCVACWMRSHGSPQLNTPIIFAPLVGSANFACMATIFSNALAQPISEGVLSNLHQPMAANNLYYGSYKLRTPSSNIGTLNSIDAFFSNSATSNLPPPSIATGAELPPSGIPMQPLNYVTTFFANTAWQTFNFCLQAQNNWDQFSIYPTENSIFGSVNWLFFDNLEINRAIDLGPDITVSGCKVTLDNRCAPPNCTYQWSSSDPLIFLTPTSSVTDIVLPTNTTTLPIQYTCTLTATMTTVNPADVCTGYDVITITVLPYNFSAVLTQNDVNCVAGNNGLINLTTNGGTAPLTYNWSTGSNNQNIINLNAGTYTVTVTDNGGCTISNSLTLYDCCTTPNTNGYVLTGNYSAANMLTNLANFPFLSNQNGFAQFSNNFNGNPCLPNQELVLNGTLTIDVNTIFWNLNLICGPQARIIINNGFCLKFEGNSVYIHGCGGRMWEGIIINNCTNANAVSFYNKTLRSYIEDAEHAIAVNGTAIVRADYVTFNKCHEGIVFNQSNGFSINSNIRASHFQSNSLCNGLAQLCLPPYAGQRAQSGVVVNPLSTIDIGADIIANSTTDQNVFRNLGYGIYVDGSNVLIRNNLFVDMSQLVVKSGLGIGIFSTGGHNFPAPPSNITVGSLSAGEINIFQDCYYGIKMRKAANNIIFNNQFNNVCYGIDARVTQWVTNGFYQNNTFNNTLGNQYYNASQAIILANPFAAAAHTTIEGNTITNYRIGIHGNNINDLRIQGSNTNHNAVTWIITNANIGPLHIGAWLEDCNDAQVHYMQIQKTTGIPASLWDVIGISVDNSQTCMITENKMTTLGSGFRIKGVCTSTELHCNIMDACSRGANLVSATMSTQGNVSTFNAWGNQWKNMGSPTRVNSNFISTSVEWYSEPPLNINNTYWPDNVVSVVDDQPANTTDPCITQIINHDSDMVADDVLDVIDGSGNGGGTSGGNADYYEKDYAIRQLRTDSTLLDSTSIYYNDRVQFLNEMAATAIGKFYDVVAYLNRDMESNALALLQTIVPDNTIEENMYQTLHIYLTTYALNKIPNDAQWNILLSIAQQNVFSGGPGVYNARAMTSWEQDDLPNVARQGNFSEQSVSLTEKWHPQFYPNPTTNVLELPYIIPEFEIIKVEVFDMYGILVTSKYFTEGKQIRFEIQNKLSGIYYVKTLINDAFWFNSKVTLLK